MGHAHIANNAWGTVANSVGGSDTTISLVAGQGTRFPDTTNGDWFYLTLIDPTGVLEITKITSRNGDILTAERGVDGTAPHAFPAGSACELRLVSRIFNVDFLNAFMARDGQYPATADLDMAGHTVKNLKDPAAPQDAVTLAFLKVQFPIGAGMMWWGDWAANKAAIEAAGWRLCDGTNGTPDMRNRFLRGAGGNVSGDTGGADSIALNWNQMPVHSHGVNDGGHGHSLHDPGHNHGVNDPGHDHDAWVDVNIGPNNWNSGSFATGVSRFGSTQGHPKAIMGAGTGIYLNASGTGMWLDGSGANISIQNSGSGSPFDNRPVFTGWHFLLRVA